MAIESTNTRPDILYNGKDLTMRIFLGGDSREDFLQQHTQSPLIDYDAFRLGEARRAILLPTFAKVLDFDGTMFDTGIIQHAVNEPTFVALGVKAVITPEIVESFRGKSDEAIFTMLLGPDNQHRVVEGIKIRNEYLREFVVKEPNLAQYLKPGMEEFVRLMRVTGQRVGIATASPEAYVREFLRRVEIDGQPIMDVFPLEAVIGSDTIRQISVVTGDEPKFKPDPFSVRLTASMVEKMTNSPIFYGGDSLVDGFTLRNSLRNPSSPNIGGILISDKEKTRRGLEDEFNGNENIIFGKSLLLLVA